MINRKAKDRKRSEAERAAEYKRQIQAMEKRVASRPLLFERTAIDQNKDRARVRVLMKMKDSLMGIMSSSEIDSYIYIPSPPFLPIITCYIIQAIHKRGAQRNGGGEIPGLPQEPVQRGGGRHPYEWIIIM